MGFLFLVLVLLSSLAASILGFNQHLSDRQSLVERMRAKLFRVFERSVWIPGNVGREAAAYRFQRLYLGIEPLFYPLSALILIRAREGDAGRLCRCLVVNVEFPLGPAKVGRVGSADSSLKMPVGDVEIHIDQLDVAVDPEH